jgi:hypothetical protein
LNRRGAAQQAAGAARRRDLVDFVLLLPVLNKKKIGLKKRIGRDDL